MSFAKIMLNGWTTMRFIVPLKINQTARRGMTGTGSINSGMRMPSMNFAGITVTI